MLLRIVLYLCMYHWQSQNVKVSGVDDMVLLPKITEDAITENLRKRYMDDYIFTCIGPVLVSINPFKQMPYFGDKEIEIYQGAVPYENPPHIYGLADNMYRNMLIDKENQCVIISGESGAGKTVSAKYIMSYIAKISGGGTHVQKVKNVILESNPLLEAFGNAKTVRNNNSSRFGKYVEMQFGPSGQPSGGKISNFLLEKSRVTCYNIDERNFHVFYQLVTGANQQMKSELGLVDVDYYHYLNYGEGHKVHDVNDVHDFEATLKALNIMAIGDSEVTDIFRLVAGILHIGNIQFVENGNYSQIADKRYLDFPSHLLEISVMQLSQKLISRQFESKWGSQSESVDVTLNVEQAVYTRDALAKDIYARLFDYLVKKINSAMETNTEGLEIGILDIYGFEIFEKNGFEQFCINFVNEKLQQIFIELTLKAEQEEYVSENIQWTPIEYFNNAVVVELLEGKRPPGLFLVLDDVCATLHGGSAGADADLQKKLAIASNEHEHFQSTQDGFAIMHYAGIVSYSVDGFCDKNRDVLFLDLVELMQTSTNSLIQKLYPPECQTNKIKTLRSRPTTAGNKIRNQASRLVNQLMKCTPHYIRCIKPNETKRPRDWDSVRIKHQVEYLGLKENIRVRRAGFAYRRPFAKFLRRYGILTKETWPRWSGNEKQGVEWILKSLDINRSQYQLGKTKLFIKAPESLFTLEEARDRKYNMYARVIQKAFKKYFARKRQEQERQEAADLLFGRKERRRASLNRHFMGDYIGLDDKPQILNLIGRREKIFFAEVVKKYDRRFKTSRINFILTNKYLYLIGQEQIKKGPEKGKLVEIIKRKLPFNQISYVSLSKLQDGFLIIHVKEDYDSLLELIFKTEFLINLSKRYVEETGHILNIKFSNNLEYKVKKEGWGSGGTREIHFIQMEYRNKEILKTSGKILNVWIGPGLPCTTNLNITKATTSTKQQYNTLKTSHPFSTVSLQSGQNRSIQKTTRSVITEQNQILDRKSNNVSPPNTNVSGEPTFQLPVKKISTVNPSNTLHTSTETKEKKQITKQPRKIQNNGVPLMGMYTNPNDVPRAGLLKFPPPPSEPPPPQTPLAHPGFRLPPIDSDDRMNNIKDVKHNKGMQTVIGQVVNKTGDNKSRVVPPNKPRPQKPAVPKLPKARALYDYNPQDHDEIGLKEGDIVEILKEHEGGWWYGRLKGKKGLFPSNYVVKI
ncbi:unconventional myosin-Ie isoform X1 [Bombus fervidus]|uniref:unconventional myosin-Ie isoform X1 n=2 Tax=Bombus fervidus TaxID=203811 RepID=UPI003AB57DF1